LLLLGGAGLAQDGSYQVAADEDFPMFIGD